jgi:hypothetical protein
MRCAERARELIERRVRTSRILTGLQRLNFHGALTSNVRKLIDMHGIVSYAGECQYRKNG